jgi:4-nitrophenyl phosphatase
MYRALLIDVDGVVKRGSTVLPRVPEAIHLLRSRPIKFVLVTNNSTKTAATLRDDLNAQGLGLSASEIVTSSQVLVDLLKHRRTLSVKAERGVLVVGEEGLRQELESNGYKVSDGPTDGLVVVGLDRRFNYSKLTAAVRSLMMGAQYLCTNTDRTYPCEDGVMPGAGSMVAAISAASGRRPTVVGKPSRVFLNYALRTLGFAGDPKGVLVVGDRPETDVKMAAVAGCHSALVLSGVTLDASSIKGKYRPTYVFRDLYHAVEKLL